MAGAGAASGALTGGNIAAAGPVIPQQPLDEILASGSLAATSDDAKAESSAASQENAESHTVANSSGWPLRPAAQRTDTRLRDRYLWRAWLENATEFHAHRTNGQPLTVYQPGEGYAVLAAAYQPMIQPVDPRDRAPEGRSIYQDRRDRGPAPGEEEQESEAAEATERAAQKAEANRVRGGSGGFARSFQPWDSEIVGDPFGPANSLVGKVPGLRIEQVVLSQGFTSNSYPIGQGASLPFANPNLGYDLDIGAMATVTWSHARPTGGFFLSYTPSHIRRKNFSEWNSTDHQLTMGASKRYARLNVSLNSVSAVRGLQQVLFTPSVLRPVADAPGSFDDLVAAVEGGHLSNDEIASVLTGAPVVESPAKTRFDLARVLSSTLGVSASYSHSARLSSHFGVNGNHFQTLSNPASDDTISGLQGLFRSSSVAGNGGINYKVSPEMSVGVDTSVNRNYSSYRDSTSINTTASVNRRIGRSWSVNGGAGIGQVEVAPLSSTVLVPGPTSTPVAADPFARSVTTWIVNGGVNYTGRTHSFSVSASRTAGDSVGLGATDSEQATAQWTWARPSSMWGLQGQASIYRMSLDAVHGNMRGGLAGFGLIRRLSRETAFQANYSYQTFQSPFRGVVSNLSGHRVQMSWVWRPTGPPR
jgi:hypothetical protein